jgi:integrase
MPYRLIAEWALTTGMRRKELCGMTVNQVLATAHLNADEHPLMGVALTITKGDHPRTVYPPIGLIDRTHRYINEELEPAAPAPTRQAVGIPCPSDTVLESGRPRDQ